MANETRQIRIESILGGHAPSLYFSAEDQFRTSIDIDPALYESDEQTSLDRPATGMLRPVGVFVSGTTVALPLWIRYTPKNSVQYVYDAAGSVYASGTGIGDLNDGGDASGNGMAYYDNYVYFARDTTVARYGPLDGTAAFTDDYWVGTLGLTALTNTTSYPQQGINANNDSYPNHVMHRHSDGRLYFGDVIGNQGAIHYIQTTKTTVEGDTNNGSTYNALDLGFGLWPTAIESYGESLAIALYEGSSTSLKTGSAKIAFWDTISDSPNLVIFSEFPDQFISALKNVNGVLYIMSGNNRGRGFRVSRYVGGTTIEEVGYFEYGLPPFPGAVDGNANRLIFGSYTGYPSNEECGVVYSLGLQKSSLGNGMFCTRRAGADTFVSALTLNNRDLGRDVPIIADSAFNVLGSGQYSDTYPALWQSQFYRIGQPFKIKKISFPIIGTGSGLDANAIVTPSIFVDGDSVSTSLTPISTSNYSSGQKIVTQRYEDLKGSWGFFLQLKWTGSVLCTMGLPITIEYELINSNETA